MKTNRQIGLLGWQPGAELGSASGPLPGGLLPGCPGITHLPRKQLTLLLLSNQPRCSGLKEGSELTGYAGKFEEEA